MLPRDNLGYDFIHNHYPKTEFANFKKDLFSADKGTKWLAALPDQDQQKLLAIEKQNIFIKSGVPVVSSIGALLFHKLPVASSIENKWLMRLRRVTTFGALIFLAQKYCTRQRDAFIANLYGKNRPYYNLYKYTGDVRSMNPDVKLVPLRSS